MSLACLACHVLDSSPERTLRSYSDNGTGCIGLGCWTRKEPAQTSAPPTADSDALSRTRQQQVAPVPTLVNNPNAATEEPGTPKLTRCHAVRRDLFRDWNFEEMSRQLCMDLSGTA